MICPECGNPDAYDGLNGINCKHASCKHYKVTNISGSSPVSTPITPKTPKTISTIDDQQYIARHVLYESKAFGNVIIAGGAPRDWAQGKLANDVDIFCDFDPNNMSNIRKSLYLPKLNKFTNIQKKQTQYNTTLLHEVYAEDFQGVKFQWIFPNLTHFNLPANPATLLQFISESFDFDICKCFWDGRVIDAQQAVHDFTNKTLTVSLEKLMRYDRLRTLPGRSKKMQKYFPDNKIVINP